MDIRTMWSSVTSGLEEHGFEVEALDWVDPLGGPTKWVMARKDTLLDSANFLALVNAFVSGRYGSIVVIEAGP